MKIDDNELKVLELIITTRNNCATPPFVADLREQAEAFYEGAAINFFDDVVADLRE